MALKYFTNTAGFKVFTFYLYAHTISEYLNRGKMYSNAFLQMR